jgi:hypothetical protein
MAKGVLFGLLYNLVVAIGLVTIADFTLVKNDLLKSWLMLCIAAAFALPLIGFLYWVGAPGVQLPAGGIRVLWPLVVGSILALVIGEAVYIVGLSASSPTVISYAALAYPATVLIVEIVAGRVALQSLSFRDLVAFILLAAGFILIATRDPGTQ